MPPASREIRMKPKFATIAGTQRSYIPGTTNHPGVLGRACTPLPGGLPRQQGSNSSVCKLVFLYCCLVSGWWEEKSWEAQFIL